MLSPFSLLSLSLSPLPGLGSSQQKFPLRLFVSLLLHLVEILQEPQLLLDVLRHIVVALRLNDVQPVLGYDGELGDHRLESLLRGVGDEVEDLLRRLLEALARVIRMSSLISPQTLTFSLQIRVTFWLRKPVCRKASSLHDLMMDPMSLPPILLASSARLTPPMAATSLMSSSPAAE